jgi:hypothetical protein
MLAAFRFFDYWLGSGEEGKQESIEVGNRALGAGGQEQPGGVPVAEFTVAPVHQVGAEGVEFDLETGFEQALRDGQGLWQDAQ